MSAQIHSIGRQLPPRNPARDAELDAIHSLRKDLLRRQRLIEMQINALDMRWELIQEDIESEYRRYWK